MAASLAASLADGVSPAREPGTVGLEAVKKLERMGQRAFARGEYPAATAHTSRAIKALQTELASLLCLRAAIELQSKEFGNAISDAENAVQLHKSSYKGYLRKGAVLLAMNEPMEAAEQLETALQLAPHQPEVKRTLREAYKSIANNCYQQGHYDFAIRWCDHTVEVLRTEDLAEEEFSQQMALSYSSRAQANLRQANYREALKDAELCVFYNPWWMKGWLTKGLALSNLGSASDLDAALDAVEEGLLLDPKSAELNDALARVRALVDAREEERGGAPVLLLGAATAPDLGMDFAASHGDDVPQFHEEWSRQLGNAVVMMRTAESLEVGLSSLYDSYLRARNLKLHLFSLETYDFGADDHLLWERVGCRTDALRWWETRPGLGSVRAGGDMWRAAGDDPEDILHVMAISPARARGASPGKSPTRRGGMKKVVNRSFLPHPPMKLTLQVYRTVSMVMFNCSDLLTVMFSSVVYADSASALHVHCYDSSAYALAKTAVVVQMLSQDAPLECALQVWFSSGWSLDTDAAFRRAALAISRQESAFEVPYEACVIIQIWSGAPQIDRLDSLPMWRARHADCDLAALAANLTHAQDRVDYCQYCLTGELLHCEVGSIVMFTPHSDHQVMAPGESILQAIPMAQLHTAYHRDGTLIKTVVGLLRRRLHLMRLRLQKMRLKVDLYTSPLPPTPVTPLSDPVVAKELAKVKARGAAHFYWGALPDRYGGHGMAELVERCGAGEAKNYALSFLWSRKTFGTHLMDYDRDERCALIEGCWREVQQALRMSGTKFFSEKPFANPHVVCGWALERRYHHCWTQHFFASFPDAVVHSAATSDFSAFSQQPPLCMAWTPQRKPPAPAAPRSEASMRSPGLSAATPRGPPTGHPHTHTRMTTSAQCGTCEEPLLLDVRPSPPRRKTPGTRGRGRGEELGVMMDIFGSGEQHATPAQKLQFG